MPFDAFVDGREVETWYKPISGGKLVLLALPGRLCGYDMKKVDLSVLKTKISEYREPFPCVTDLGDIPTLVAYRKGEISMPLQEGFLIDVMAFGDTEKGRRLLSAGRLATSEISVPYDFTQDQTKLLEIERRGLTPEMVRGRQARFLEPFDFSDRRPFAVEFEMVS